MIFRTPEFGSSVVNTHKIDEIQVLVLAPFLGLLLEVFWETEWRPRPSKSHFKKMMPKMSPNWSHMGSQNGAKIVKNEVLEAPCFKGGSQVASRAPPGSILERFWDHFP